MRCSECPYGEYDYTRRVNMYDAIVAEQGIPNDVYGDMSRDEAVDKRKSIAGATKLAARLFGQDIVLRCMSLIR